MGNFHTPMAASSFPVQWLQEQAEKAIQSEAHVFDDEEDFSDDPGGKATGLDPTPKPSPPVKKRPAAPTAKPAGPAPASKKARKAKKKGEAA